jgi:hypothetical protein
MYKFFLAHGVERRPFGADPRFNPQRIVTRRIIPLQADGAKISLGGSWFAVGHALKGLLAHKAGACQNESGSCEGVAGLVPCRHGGSDPHKLIIFPHHFR